jgi:hypothetical protein
MNFDANTTVPYNQPCYEFAFSRENSTINVKSAQGAPSLTRRADLANQERQQYTENLVKMFDKIIKDTMTRNNQ